MSRIDALLKNYARYVSLPWDQTLPGAQRVWFAVYDKTDERRLRLRITKFEMATKDAGHSWSCCDLTNAFPRWMADQEYRERYFKSPQALPTPHKGFAEYAAAQVQAKLAVADENTVVAVVGVGALFGFMKVSNLMEAVERSIRGRLLVFFPGEYTDNNYRLLDARDGWNYHAVPITATGGLLEA